MLLTTSRPFPVIACNFLVGQSGGSRPCPDRSEPSAAASFEGQPDNPEAQIGTSAASVDTVGPSDMPVGPSDIAAPADSSEEPPGTAERPRPFPDRTAVAWADRNRLVIPAADNSLRLAEAFADKQPAARKMALQETFPVRRGLKDLTTRD